MPIYCCHQVNFADVKMPKVLDFPRPQKIAPLAGVHAVSSEPMVIVDAQTLLIPSFSYDGEAPGIFSTISILRTLRKILHGFTKTNCSTDTEN